MPYNSIVPMKAENSKPLNKAELAARYRVSQATINRWMADRRIGYLKAGGMIRFTQQHIEAFEGGHNHNPI